MDRTTCDIYACRQPALVSPPPTTVTINGEVFQLELCDEHRTFFQATNPDQYAIGRTFTGEIEVRNIPAQPVAPRNPASTHNIEDNA